VETSLACVIKSYLRNDEVAVLVVAPTLSRGCYFIPRVAGYIRRGSDTHASPSFSRDCRNPFTSQTPDRASVEVPQRTCTGNYLGLVVVIRFRLSASYRSLACRRRRCRGCETRVDFVAAAM